MRIGIIGLGRMGANMTRRLIQGGHEVVVHNRSDKKIHELTSEGAIAAFSLQELVGQLTGPRVVWLMLPAGDIIDQHLEELSMILNKGDLIIDGANGYYKDDITRAKRMKEKGIHYMDAGVSGGVWGLKVGYCTMIGGEKSDFEHMQPILDTLCPPNGYLYCGPHGAGHFVKMVHNGIEYAMMEAYGEGFEILQSSPYAEHFNMSDVAHIWNQGSVVRSWLLELLEDAFKKDPKLQDVDGYVEDSGEGRWTVQQAVDTGVSATGIAHALFKRFESRQKDVFSNKVLAALRNEFGGHALGRPESMDGKSAGAGEVSHARADQFAKART